MKQNINNEEKIQKKLFKSKRKLQKHNNIMYITSRSYEISLQPM